MDQLVLALPSRDYYLKPSSAGDMAAYHKYMTQIAILLGANKTTAADELQEVIKFEIKLANVSIWLRDKISKYIKSSSINIPTDALYNMKT